MTPVLLMTIAIPLFVVFLILTIVNFLRVGKKGADSVKNFFNEGDDPTKHANAFAKNLGGGFACHIVLGICTSLSGIVAVAGFIWFLVEKLT